MSVFPIAVFPEASLASSVVTTVWIGVLVFGYFHLRLGWVFSGLVVPGYLVPIIILRPYSALTILIESAIAYGLVRLTRNVMVRGGTTCELFGRDRFFALILASVVVRMLADGLIWPLIGDALFQHYGFEFDYQHQLSSFGLIVICLVANQFWKTGLVGGLLPFLTVLGTTFLIIRYGLMELTNFSMSNLAYLYEDVATSLEASPKAYIVLITTAFLASRMNVLYGWDFSGIMIPALIALQWFEPLKILTSIIESVIILSLGILALKLPLFRSLTIEGARKVMLFFTISYLYKVTVSYLLMEVAPDFKVSDAYGFGYLLPTLMATKMHQTGHVISQLRMTLQLSSFSMVVASLLGFGLTLIPRAEPVTSIAAIERSSAQTTGNRSLWQAIRQEEIRSMQMHLRRNWSQPSVQQREAFRMGIQAAARYADSSDPTDLHGAQHFLRRVGYRIEELERQYLLVFEGPRYRGWGLYVIDRNTQNRLCVECPHALDEDGTFEAASAVFDMANARSLAFSTTPLRGTEDDSSVLIDRLSLFHIFHRLQGDGGVIQIRGYTDNNSSTLEDAWPQIAATDDSLQSSCWIKNRPPEGFNFASLGDVARQLAFPRVIPPTNNAQRDTHRSRFVELFLTEDHLGKLTRAHHEGVNQERPELITDISRPQPFLLDKLSQSPPLIAPKGTDLYQSPRTVDLLYMDAKILAPLVKLAQAWPRSNGNARMALLSLLQQRAESFHYQIKLLGTRAQQSHVVIMPAEEPLHSRARHWGILVIRLGDANEVVLEIPRPGAGLQVVNFALTWYEPLRARALLIAGAHPDTNQDRSADILLAQNKRSLFTLAHEVILREFRDKPLLALQCRALAEVEAGDLGVLSSNVAYLATDNEAATGRLLRDVETHLLAASLSVKRVNGGAATAGYDVGSHLHTRYLAASPDKGFGILWLSPQLRAQYAPQDARNLAIDALASLGIPTEQDHLVTWLSSRTVTSAPAALKERMVQAVDRFKETGDVNVIHELLVDYPMVHFKRLLDLESGQSFLVANQDEQWSAVMSIQGTGIRSWHPWTPTGSREELVSLLVTHQRRLLVGPPGGEDTP